jgi:hypothetical protein
MGIICTPESPCFFYSAQREGEELIMHSNIIHLKSGILECRWDRRKYCRDRERTVVVFRSICV